MIMCFMNCSPCPRDEITHGGDGKVHDIVHAACVDGVNHRTPLVTLTPMRIEERSNL